MCVVVVSLPVFRGACSFFFFFKQKTAYEMLRSLVGSEMCIRDRRRIGLRGVAGQQNLPLAVDHRLPAKARRAIAQGLSLIHI